MIISTDEYTLSIKKSLDSPFIEVSSSSEDLELFYNAIELAGANPYQSLPLEKTTEGALLILPEVLCLWFNFEILNFGV